MKEHLNIFWIATRPRVFWSAAIYCRFDIFRIAVRPRTALELRHVPVFGVRQFIAALEYFGLRYVLVPL